MKKLLPLALLCLLLCGCEGFRAAFRPASEQPEHLRRKPKTTQKAKPAQNTSPRTRRSNSGSFSEFLFDDEEKVTHLSGLNETEMAALKEAKGPARKSSVFNNESIRNNSPLLNQSAKELNEYDRNSLEYYIDDSRKQSTRDSHWVY